MPCSVSMSGTSASNRVAPTAEEADWITLFLPHDCQVDYKSRIVNVKQKLKNEMIFDGPFEVKQIDKALSFDGLVLYLVVTAKGVIE